MSQRLIMVDDTDSSIHYTGQGWFQDTGSRDGAGNFGPTYKHILHGTKSDGSFSFQFNGELILFCGNHSVLDINPLVGTLVKIYGTNNRVNTTSGWDPRWECFIDNVSIGATDPFPYDENNWLLCGQTDLNDGLHTITVNVTSTTGQPFWFDYVQYAPSSSVSEETAYIVVDHLDPGIEYGIGWVALGGTANMTSNHGSELWFNFTGDICERPGCPDALTDKTQGKASAGSALFQPNCLITRHQQHILSMASHRFPLTLLACPQMSGQLCTINISSRHPSFLPAHMPCM
jgi:hypothetical protein